MNKQTIIFKVSRHTHPYSIAANGIPIPNIILELLPLPYTYATAFMLADTFTVGYIGRNKDSKHGTV